jgi:hypothetical protein
MWDVPEEDGRIPSEMEWFIYLPSDDDDDDEPLS